LNQQEKSARSSLFKISEESLKPVENFKNQFQKSILSQSETNLNLSKKRRLRAAAAATQHFTKQSHSFDTKLKSNLAARRTQSQLKTKSLSTHNFLWSFSDIAGDDQQYSSVPCSSSSSSTDQDDDDSVKVTTCVSLSPFVVADSYTTAETTSSFRELPIAATAAAASATQRQKLLNRERPGGTKKRRLATNRSYDINRSVTGAEEASTSIDNAFKLIKRDIFDKLKNKSNSRGSYSLENAAAASLDSKLSPLNNNILKVNKFALSDDYQKIDDYDYFLDKEDYSQDLIIDESEEPQKSSLIDMFADDELANNEPTLSTDKGVAGLGFLDTPLPSSALDDIRHYDDVNETADRFNSVDSTLSQFDFNQYDDDHNDDFDSKSLYNKKNHPHYDKRRHNDHYRLVNDLNLKREKRNKEKLKLPPPPPPPPLSLPPPQPYSVSFAGLLNSARGETQSERFRSNANRQYVNILRDRLISNTNRLRSHHRYNADNTDLVVENSHNYSNIYDSNAARTSSADTTSRNSNFYSRINNGQECVHLNLDEIHHEDDDFNETDHLEKLNESNSPSSSDQNDDNDNDNDDNDVVIETDDQEIKIKKAYTWPIKKGFQIAGKLYYLLDMEVPVLSHYDLCAALDRNKSWSDLWISVVLSTLSSAVASLVFLNENIYGFGSSQANMNIFVLVLFCFILASSQYSLVKSVQPDSSSPIHGFNRLTALSRPIYFCILTLLILMLDQVNKDKSSIFSISLVSHEFSLALCLFSDYAQSFLLFFPVIFTLGLLPQINTFALSLIEQIEIYLLGGTAQQSLLASLITLLRSLASILGLTLILALSVYSIPNSSDSNNTSPDSPQMNIANISHLAAKTNQYSQSVLFSVYCACTIATSFLLSRQTSDVSTVFKAFKELIHFDKPKQEQIELMPRSPMPPTSDGDNDDLKQLDSKLRRVIRTRCESDFILCVLIFLAVFALHVSTLFTVLRPFGSATFSF
jgi:hypothetical protein